MSCGFCGRPPDDFRKMFDNGICDECHFYREHTGLGGIPFDLLEKKACSGCFGSGQSRRVTHIQVMCGDCWGEGWVFKRTSPLELLADQAE